MAQLLNPSSSLSLPAPSSPRYLYLASRGVERLDVVSDDRVQGGRLRPVALVATDAGRGERNRGKAHGERTGRAPCRGASRLNAAAGTVDIFGGPCFPHGPRRSQWHA